MMLLSIQQRYIMEILRSLKYIRRQQLLVLVREKFRRPDLVINDRRMDAMLRQLRFGVEEFRIEGDLVKLANAEVDPLQLEAIDVMLELSQGKAGNFRNKLAAPYILSFSMGEDIPRLISVAYLSPGVQPEMVERRHKERIIWISDSGIVPPELGLPEKHYFAARQEDGTHRFYGSNEP